MGNPLLVVLNRLLNDTSDKQRPGQPALPNIQEELASGGILLVLRRMRIPLIVLIVIFAVSVLGLTLIPGEDPQGRSERMSIFDAFYFMSYTASTIGFGELPFAFTAAQRMWVTVSIFMSVIGWAYAVGSVLALTQDRAFRHALARRHFARKVAKLGEPFLLLVGYGDATKRLARSLDDMGRRFVVVDRDENRVLAVELDSYHSDTPAMLGDARDTAKLALAGLGHRHCEGVVALTGHDRTNLDVTMTTALLRPGLPVIARAGSREMAERMKAFGKPEIVNPLDRFGDHLRILLRSPAAYQLMIWLTSAPGTALPRRREQLPRGSWVVYGYGDFGQELTADLRAEGLDVTVIEGEGSPEEQGGASETELMEAAGVAGAVGFVAATESDMTNLWLLQAARRANPDTFLVAMQNRAANAPLFREVGVHFGLAPAEVIAHEVLARLANPVLMRFLPQVPRQSAEWSEQMIDRLVHLCGRGTPSMWRICLTEEETPGLTSWLDTGEVRVGQLFRNPGARERRLGVVPLALLRGETSVLAPEDDFVLRRDDRLLIAGRPSARQALDATLVDGPTAAYVIGGHHVASSWVWRKLAGQSGRTEEQRSDQQG